MVGATFERPGFRLSKFFGKRGFLTAIFSPSLRGPWFLSAERGPFGRYYYFSEKKSDTLGTISRGSFAFHNDISPFYFILLIGFPCVIIYFSLKSKFEKKIFAQREVAIGLW